MITRRLKSPTQPKQKRKVVVTGKTLQKRQKAKALYRKNKSKILKAAKVRRQRRTQAEKNFDKKRAMYLRSLSNTVSAKVRSRTTHIKRF